MQQINFYLPEFQPNREPFRSSQIVLILGVLICLFGIVTIKSAFDNKSMQAKILQETEQVNSLRGQFQQFANSKTKVNLIELDNKILQLKNEIARRQQLLHIISYQRLGNDQGFSTQLEAMARQSNKYLALEIFSLKNGGSYLELVGKTTSAELLPAYIIALKSESAFSDVSFGVVSMEPVNKNSGYLQFVVAEPKPDTNGEKMSAVQSYVKTTEGNGKVRGKL